jgi:hypothetical protein
MNAKLTLMNAPLSCVSMVPHVPTRLPRDQMSLSMITNALVLLALKGSTVMLIKMNARPALVKMVALVSTRQVYHSS